VNVPEVIGCLLVTAAVAWGVTLAQAAAAMARTRAAMQEEIRYWQAETAKARARTAQLAQEIATWSKGCQQGREDMIAIMPLLIAAQNRPIQSTPVGEPDANG